MKGANKSGSNAENIVYTILKTLMPSKCHSVVRQHVFSSKELRESPLITKTIRVDFLVRGLANYESGLIVEVKRQKVGGSVVEKIPYQIDYEIKRYYPYPSILILEGKYYQDNRSKWEIHTSQIRDKWLICTFFSYDELQSWCESLPEIPREFEPKIYEQLPIWNGIIKRR